MPNEKPELHARAEAERELLETLLTAYTGSRERARAWLARIDAEAPVGLAELEVLAELAYANADGGAATDGP